MKHQSDASTKLRNYKPYRTIRVNDPYAPHGVDSRLILEVYPNGLIYIREHGRRVRREIQVSNIYVRCIMRDIAKLPRKRRKS